LKGSRKDCLLRREEKLRTDRSFSLFPLQKKIVAQIQAIETGKKTFAKVSQLMFSEIMSAFTEVAEMHRNEEKKKAKTALYFQSNVLAVRYQSSTK